ncbi:MAG: hypothetical protein ACR2FO_01085 [Actinomycetota bacterium]
MDFNEEDDRGRILAPLGDAPSGLQPGEFVMAEDNEGHRCKARVDEVSDKRGLVYLTPVEGTWESSGSNAWFDNPDRSTPK